MVKKIYYVKMMNIINQGYWKKDKRCGFGTFIWPNLGCKYSGEWLEDKRHGKNGRFYWQVRVIHLNLKVII